MIRQGRAQFPGFDIKLIAPQPRHHQIADDGIVLVGLDLEQGFLAIKGDVHQEVFVGQNPLQSGSQLLVVINQENGLEGKSIGGARWAPGGRVRIHRKNLSI